MAKRYSDDSSRDEDFLTKQSMDAVTRDELNNAFPGYADFSLPQSIPAPMPSTDPQYLSLADTEPGRGPLPPQPPPQGTYAQQWGLPYADEVAQWLNVGTPPAAPEAPEPDPMGNLMRLMDFRLSQPQLGRRRGY